MVRIATLLIAALFVPLVTADHISPGEIRWACGFGGSGQRGHPDQCAIDPVGGGADVGQDGDPVWGDPWVDEDEPILGLVVDGEARAVPVVMLDSHEIANVEVAGTAVAITYCPLCGSGLAFLREVQVGGTTRTLDFTASGFLFQNDLVMWDPQTGTLWNQITGTPIATLEEERVVADHLDATLDTIPLLVTSWGEWLDEHPGSLMLQKVRAGYSYPYGGYATDAQRCGLSTCTGADDRLHPKEMVIGVAEPLAAFPIFGVRALGGVLIQEVDGVTLAVTATPEGGHRVLDATGIGLDNSTGSWVDAEGDTWDLIANNDTAGDRLPEVDSVRLFWFAWADHHPDTFLWQPPEGTTISDGPGAPLKRDNGKLPGFTIPLVAAFLIVGALFLRMRR